ncbi:MAG: class II glutamine amidotransferase [Armatimonadota bacterium]
MCGLAGMILAPKRRSRREIDWLVESFTRLLIYSEHRGLHATGVALVKTDGTYQVEKAPLPARDFVGTMRYATWTDGIDAQTTLLMGHTRWPTRGSAQDPRNNHPLLVVTATSDDRPGKGQGSHREMVSLLTHNGHLQGVEAYFQRWHLPRFAEVDSELLVQLAHRYLTPTGYDIVPLLEAMTALQGTMSAVLISSTAPQAVHLLKGNMPLEVCYHPRRDLLAYASETAILERALGDGPGWEPVPLSPGTLLTVHTDDLAYPTRTPFPEPDCCQLAHEYRKLSRRGHAIHNDTHDIAG